MAVLARIKFRNERGEIEVRTLSVNQAVTIGNSIAADIRLYDESELMPRHCDLRLFREAFVLRNLTGQSGAVLVNDQPIEEADLKDGDLITIGFSGIDISVVGEFEPKKTNDQSQDTVADSVLEPPAVEVLENDLKKFVIPENDKRNVFDLIAKKVPDRHVFGVVNYRLIGKNPNEMRLDDMLSECPDEITNENSLSIVGPIPLDEISSQDFFGERNRDCFVLAFPRDHSASEEDFVSAVESQAVWMLKPTLFDFHLSAAGELLIEQFFEHSIAYLYYDSRLESYSIVSNDEGIVSFESLVERVS